MSTAISATDARGAGRSSYLSRNASILLLTALLVATVLFFSLRVRGFFSLENLVSILLALAPIGIVCVGQTTLLIAGYFDISVGSIVGFAGVATVKLLSLLPLNGIGAPLIVLFAAVALCAILGFINGILVTKVRINALITTIATMSIIIGLSMLITKGQYLKLSDPFFLALGSREIAGILPIPILLLVGLYAIAYMVLRFTVFGRNIYAIGNNERAATYSGLNVGRITVILFVVTGALAGLSGIVLAGKLTSAQAIFGQSYPLMTIAACVLGGTAILGGRGGVVGSLLGIAFISVLKNGLILMNLPTYLQDVITGVLLLAALYISEAFVRMGKDT
jgi:ribose/xylose/arabinose/galactoside ABC-type transport system permease subunit